MAAKRKNNLPWFVYIRVSSKDQGDKYGPGRQIDGIRLWLRANAPDAIVPGLDACVISPRELRASEFIGFDRQTGKNDDRPDFQRGYQLAKDAKIGGFLALSVDRVARNVVDACLLRSRMKTMGVRLEFAAQTFDHTAAGDMMFKMYAGFAEYEGKLILERTGGGRRKRLCEDELIIAPSSLPYGYLYVDKNVAKQHPGALIGTAIINEEEAEIVRLIFRMYVAEGKTRYEIMQHLNGKKVPAQKGGAWWPATVGKILGHADTYAGKYVVRLGIEAAKREYEERLELMGENAEPLDLSGVEAIEYKLPAIIDNETARLTKATLTSNKVKKAGRPTKHYPLSKLVYCGECGGDRIWYFNSHGANKPSWGYCSSYSRHYASGRNCPKCSSSSMQYDKLESLVIDSMKDYLRQPHVAHATAMQVYREEHGSDASQRRAESVATLESLRQQQQYFGTVILNPALTKLHDNANRQFAELEIQIQQLERDLRRAPVTEMYSEASITTAFESNLRLLDRMTTFSHKQEFFNATLQRVDMHREEMVIKGTIAVPQEMPAGGGGKLEPLACPQFQFTPFPFVIRKRVRAA